MKFFNRIVRACKLDISLYEEVEADKEATFQAASVVILSIIAFGFANFINYGSLCCFFSCKVGRLYCGLAYLLLKRFCEIWIACCSAREDSTSNFLLSEPGTNRV